MLDYKKGGFATNINLFKSAHYLSTKNYAHAKAISKHNSIQKTVLQEKTRMCLK